LFEHPHLSKQTASWTCSSCVNSRNGHSAPATQRIISAKKVRARIYGGLIAG
jgi:hypothetical protein